MAKRKGYERVAPTLYDIDARTSLSGGYIRKIDHKKGHDLDVTVRLLTEIDTKMYRIAEASGASTHMEIPGHPIVGTPLKKYFIHTKGVYHVVGKRVDEKIEFTSVGVEFVEGA